MTDQVDVAIKKRLSVLSPDKLKKLKTALLKEQERLSLIHI